MAYNRLLTRTRTVGVFQYSDEVVEDVRSCQFECRRSGGLAWARIRMAREFHELSEFTRGDEYLVYYESGDLRFKGRIARVRRTAKGGEIEILLTSSLDVLDGIYPLFPTDAESFQTHPNEADVSYWVKAILDEWVVPNSAIVYLPEDVPETGFVIDRPILDRRISISQVFHLFAMGTGFSVWGIDTEGKFFFRPRANSIQAKFHIGVDRGWGEVDVLEDVLTEPVNYLRIAGEIPAELTINGDIEYPTSPDMFRKEYSNSESIVSYGRKAICLYAPGLRSEALSEAIATNLLKARSVPKQRYTLVVKGLSEVLDLRKQVVLYDEVGTKIGQYPVERVLHSLNENSSALLELGPWPMEMRFHLSEQRENGRIGQTFLAAYPNE